MPEPSHHDRNDGVRHVSLNDLPDGCLVIILQKVARATGRVYDHTSVCKRWRRLMPLTQVYLKLERSQGSRVTPFLEPSWAELIRRSPNLDTLEIVSDSLLSDFILGAIGSSSTKLETLSLRGEIFPSGVRAVGWTLEGLLKLLYMKRDLRSLTLDARGLYGVAGELYLPESLTNLTRLTSLTCRGVWDVEAADRLLGRLTKLRELELWGESAAMPDSSTELTNLTKLTVCDYAQLPEELGLLSKLEHLRLQGGEGSRLPASITNLKRLTTLILSDLDVVELPKDLLTLPALQHLEIKGCISLKLPTSFWEVPQGGPLSLEICEYHHKIPEALKGMVPRLQMLTVCNHKFFLPYSLGKLTNLRSLTH